jgi:BirA family biotin operon repressor/biotin-[acetyl-CoA-carboxylase] ligase
VALLKNTNILLPVSGQIIRFDVLDSSNNYAMQRINEASAVHGDIILVNRQIAGKGQRGKTWTDTPGESLLMSLIVAPGQDLSEQPLFLAAVALAVRDTVQRYVSPKSASIKWPNDILIGDKKAAGILIENVVRGSSWQWSVIGIGLNIAQISFAPELPNATSLHMEGGVTPATDLLAAEIANAIHTSLATLRSADSPVTLHAYNAYLYKQGTVQGFKVDGNIVQMQIIGMDEAGMILLNSEKGTTPYPHGSIEWIWDH